MILSKKWVNDYCDLSGISDKEFADGMTLSGSKVEAYEQEGAALSNIVLGRVEEMEKHPDSDHLWICQVNVGKEENIQIVTGAQNLKPGDYVPVALHNSHIADGTKITKGKLRGVLSNGMLCSLGELGLTINDFPNAIEDGIMVISDECDLKLGRDIQETLGFNDVKTEFEITSNRPDCMCVTGLAREAAATFGRELNIPVPEVKQGHGDVNNMLKVHIHNPELCYRYIGAVVENVRIKPSPLWMRERLRASGVRPINNIVDITNYVMLEFGQPMHAFDLRYLDGQEVNVRTAKKDETITTLDGEQRKLTEDMLVIADKNKPVAVAGVMGGEYSGIMDDTTTIVFESAMFCGYSVRKTAKALGMRTEASSRYEKELSPESCMLCIQRALELVQLLDAGDVVNGVVDCYKTKKEHSVLPLDCKWINDFIGIHLTEKEMTAILEKIGFEVKDGNVYTPYFRNDVEHLADLSEEIARFYGYQNIPNSMIRGIAEAQYTPEQKFEKKINETLLACGYSEIHTFSFISPKSYDKICQPENSKLRDSVKISNPLGEDTSVMRTTAVPSMLEVLSRNYNLRNPEAKFYEYATVYKSNGPEELPDENVVVTIGLYGENYDFYDIKGAAETIFETVGIKDYDVEAVSDDPIFHPGRTAKFTINGELTAMIGEVHPDVLANYKIGVKAYIACIKENVIFENRNTKKTYKPLPKYPAVTRDLAVVCDKKIPVLKLEKTIKEAVGKNLEEIKLFDIFEGLQVGAGNKSVAFSLKLRSGERTMTDDEADSAVKKALKALEENTGAVLRS